MSECVCVCRGGGDGNDEAIAVEGKHCFDKLAGDEAWHQLSNYLQCAHRNISCDSLEGWLAVCHKR